MLLIIENVANFEKCRSSSEMLPIVKDASSYQRNHQSSKMLAVIKNAMINKNTTKHQRYHHLKCRRSPKMSPSLHNIANHHKSCQSSKKIYFLGKFGPLIILIYIIDAKIKYLSHHRTSKIVC